MASDRDCRVVVGVDGSLASIAALRWAAQTAMERVVPLCVVGVDPDVHDSTGPYLWQQSPPQHRLAALQDTLAVAVTYDGAEVKIYINGNLDRIMPRSGALLQSLDQVFYIGRQGSQCSCNFFDGQIDDLRIWNVVRSATQIRDNYLRPLAGTCAVNGALVCFMGAHAHRVGLLQAAVDVG